MDHFDITTGVLDSWDLLNCPVLDTYKNRTEDKVREDNLKRLESSESILLKTTTYSPILNSISAGYYPSYKVSTTTYDKPHTIQVTVIPKSPQTFSNSQKRRKAHTKKTSLPTLGQSDSTNNIYVLLPGKRKDKLYAIDTTNAKIFKEINDNTLLSECILKNYIRDMNKSRKKCNEKTKEKGIKYPPECSPGCAYLNIANKTKTASPDRSGSASPSSPVRSSNKVVTKIESNALISSENRRTEGRQIRSPDKIISSEDRRAEERQIRSPDRNSLKDTAKTKSLRTSRQRTQINFYQKDRTYGKEEAIKSPDSISYLSDKRSIESVIAETKRRLPERSQSPSASRPGRIRITGRLGLTEDDKCILKCNATLDDKPIETQFQGANCAILPTCFQAYQAVCGSPRKKDANVQAKESPIAVRFCTTSTTGKESQATQVDFQLQYSSAKDRSEECNRGKTIQKCACINTIDSAKNVPNVEGSKLAYKEQQNPIIVITVYSKNGVPGDNKGNIKQKDTKVGQTKENKKLGRSRSPSPVKNSKKVGGKKSEGRVTASSSKRTIRESAKKETRSKDNKSQSRSVIRSTTITKSKTESKSNKNKTQRLHKTPPQSRRSPSPETNSNEDRVTEQMIKKALIEDFTKNYADQIMQRKALEMPLTRHDVSNITIDIEGDSDYYNVKLAQDVGKSNTEFIIRKPNRGKRAGELKTGETDTTSLENFLYVQPDDNHRRRSFSQTLMYDGTDVAIKTETSNGNELNVKDSIEISHRREHKASLEANRDGIVHPDEVDNEYSYSASNKHFKGDNCSITDPNARDKEIRRLLEIDKGIKQPTCKLRRSITTSLLGKGGQVPLHSINDSFSSTTLMNSKIILKNLDKHDGKGSLYDSIKTVKLTRPLCELIWNQNVRLLYQLKYHKQKPIVLTRHQYAKVKKTIYTTLIYKHNHLLHARWYNRNRRFYGIVGRAEAKNIILHYDKDCQTVEITYESSLQAHDLSTDQLFTMMSDIDTYIVNEVPDSGDASSTRKEIGKFSVDSSHGTFENSCNAKHEMKLDNYVHNIQRTVLIARDLNRPNSETFKEVYRRKSTSVKEIQYKKVAITKQRVKFSSSDTINYHLGGENIQKNDSYSIHTIFKSHQKSITPNLGTSANSLCDDSSERLTSRLKFFDDSISDHKPKKPFLRRLISCLVFKISPVSQPKMPDTKLKPLSPSSSFDSYHISTSLGAIEMSSSLYDTTASFYSDHTIQPITKMKRSLFSSVRGFLSRNKS